MENEEFGIIYEKEIYETIQEGEIIEDYPDDKPYPSCLIYGKTKGDRPLHIVCAYDQKDGIAFIVTAYQPNPDLWINFRERRK